MEQQRKIIFFLGAGASLGAGACTVVQHGHCLPIPTSQDFWATLLRFCGKSSNGKIIESFLFRYFLGYARTPARTKLAKRRQSLQRIDVEEVFTFLSERTRAPSTSPALKTYTEKVWIALLSELPVLFSRFGANAKTRSIYRQFVRNYVKSRDTIVSFNYDTVFESSVPRSFQWNYEGLESATSAVGILKPHGSINWEDAEPVSVCDSPKRALVVAPTHLKFVQLGASDKNSTGYLDHSQALARIWKFMEKEMREAKALVFIGYSFPLADLYFSSVLRSVLADRDGAPGIAIVNPDAAGVRERLAKRFPVEKVISYFDLRDFVRGNRRQLMDRLRA